MTTGPARTWDGAPVAPDDRRPVEAEDRLASTLHGVPVEEMPPGLALAELGRRAVMDATSRSATIAALPLRLAAPLLEPVRANLDRSIRRAVGVPDQSRRAPDDHSEHQRATAGSPPRRGRGAGQDPPALRGRRRAEHRGPLFLAPDAVARRVHGDLPSMLIGGLAALLLQTLHPRTMAGVADHSGYAVDPLGRLRRTASFVGITTFGTVADAEAAIRHVRSVHAGVTGRAPDGQPYRADDPDLLTWVHAAEMASFLAATRRYGIAGLAPGDADRYLGETAPVALALGADWVPTTEDELDAYLHSVRPQLYAGGQALAARDFLVRGVARRPEQRAVHACIAAAAIGLLPPWARRELRLPAPPLVDQVMVRPAAWTLCQGLRWAVGTGPG